MRVLSHACRMPLRRQSDSSATPMRPRSDWYGIGLRLPCGWFATRLLDYVTIGNTTGRRNSKRSPPNLTNLPDLTRPILNPLYPPKGDEQKRGRHLFTVWISREHGRCTDRAQNRKLGRRGLRRVAIRSVRLNNWRLTDWQKRPSGGNAPRITNGLTQASFFPNLHTSRRGSIRNGGS